MRSRAVPTAASTAGWPRRTPAGAGRRTPGTCTPCRRLGASGRPAGSDGGAPRPEWTRGAGWCACGLRAEAHVENLVVAVVRRAVLVAVHGRRHPHAAVRCRLDRAQPAVRTVEEDLHVGQAAAADHLAVEPGAALAGDVEHVADDGDAAARAVGHLVGVLGRDEAGRSAGAGRALTRRPAVVAALRDQVGLVHDAVAELLLPQAALRVEGQTLDVAVAVAPDRVAERVVRRDAAVRVDPQHLAVEALGVRRVVTFLRVAGAGKQELAVRAEAQPPAVVELVAGDAGQQDLLGAGGQRVGGRVVLDPHDPVVAR